MEPTIDQQIKTAVKINNLPTIYIAEKLCQEVGQEAVLCWINDCYSKFSL